MKLLPRLARPALALVAATALSAPLLADHHEGKVEAATVATMRLADGTDVGTISFTQTEHGVVVAVAVKGIPAGKHGLHIHQTGACAPDFMAAGGHFNPASTEHGFHAPGGYHAGDLPNLDVAADGTAMAEFFVPDLTIHGPVSEALPYTLHDEDGASIMIHAATDDYKTMASSGGRQACGVIVAKG
ncbi:MAG: superoxide dismutase family protein [Erythrobacter sp.]|uniref:superoxide dismutase family protein n=1 Tax=Erythrobacter sp. TaxID=1042 RepID=UPI0025DDDDEC|nr:superoxide dismutase family protein [Erythrobacter sp.]MCL9997898.1 superoxide dismutase family protein [Erythrobacter sp.]